MAVPRCCWRLESPVSAEVTVVMHNDQVEAVVQWVRTSWTKRSRGGAGATRRNAAPIAFPLPDQLSPFVHEVAMWEYEGFRPQRAVRTGLPDDGDPVLLREANGLLRVQLTVAEFGMPRRRRRPPAVRLARGEWVRWQVNYRFSHSCGGGWTYRLDTLNLFHGPAGSRDLFLGEPTYYVSELGSLR
jgi:hypothetical protein